MSIWLVYSQFSCLSIKKFVNPFHSLHVYLHTKGNDQGFWAGPLHLNRLKLSNKKHDLFLACMSLTL